MPDNPKQWRPVPRRNNVRSVCSAGALNVNAAMSDVAINSCFMRPLHAQADVMSGLQPQRRHGQRTVHHAGGGMAPPRAARDFHGQMPDNCRPQPPLLHFPHDNPTHNVVIGIQALTDSEFFGVKQLPDMLQLRVRSFRALTDIITHVVINIGAGQAMRIFTGFAQRQTVFRIGQRFQTDGEIHAMDCAVANLLIQCFADRAFFIACCVAVTTREILLRITLFAE